MEKQYQPEAVARTRRSGKPRSRPVKFSYVMPPLPRNFGVNHGRTFLLCATIAMLGCQRSADPSLGGPVPPSAEDPVATEMPIAAEEPSARPRSDKPEPRRLGDGQSVDQLWNKAAKAAAQNPAMPKNPPSLVQFVSPQRLKAAGLRIKKGKHLQLVTDLPPAAAVDE